MSQSGATTPRKVHSSSGSGGKGNNANGTPPSAVSPPVAEKDTIWKAAERGNTTVVSQFIKKKKSSLNAQNERGHTALHLAALHNCYDVVEVLLQEGADLTLKDNSGWSILHFAASGRNEKLFRLLLDQPNLPSVNDTNEGGYAPLHYLAKNLAGVSKATMQKLVDRGCNVNAQNNLGEAPIHGAALKGHYLFIERLLEFGAKPDICTNEGETPLNWATRYGHDKAISVLLKALSKKDDKSSQPDSARDGELLEKAVYELSFMGDNFTVTLTDDNWDQCLYEGGMDLLNQTTGDQSARRAPGMSANPHFEAIRREELPLSKLFHLYLVISGRAKTDPEIVYWISDFLTGPKRTYLQYLLKGYSYRIRVRPPLGRSAALASPGSGQLASPRSRDKLARSSQESKFIDIWSKPVESDNKLFEEIWGVGSLAAFTRRSSDADSDSGSETERRSGSPAPSPRQRDRSATLVQVRKITGRFSWEVDPYDVHIIEKIGNGSFGTVYRASWLGIEVALKKLNSENLSAADYKNFLYEVELMTNLRHPNIVTMLGASLEPPNLCFISEFVQQGSLDRVLKLFPHLDWKIRLNMAIETARGLLYLHRQRPPIMHRDLKSLNILVDENFHVKLTDFGLSQDKTTKMNTRVGTLNWVAPEVLEGLVAYDEKADMYSFGMVLWELLTGKTPYEGKSQLQVIRMIDMREKERIPENTDASYARIIRSCWHEDPRKRPSIQRVLRQLEDIQAALNDSIAQKSSSKKSL